MSKGSTINISFNNIGGESISYSECKEATCVIELKLAPLPGTAISNGNITGPNVSILNVSPLGFGPRW